jgi:hypothetical protein
VTLARPPGSRARGGPAWIPVFVLAIAGVASLASSAPAETWPAIDKAELQLGSPSVDPEADAEAMLWRIRVLDEMDATSIHSDIAQYLRIKIFTDRGKEIASRVDIPFESHTKIMDLAARTIRPDGSTVEVPPKAFFERTIVKVRGRKVKAMSFAFPSVERGSMIEYRWTERRYDTVSHGQQFVLQREIPVRSTELWVRPLPVPGSQFRMRSFNMPTPLFSADADGYRRTALPPTEAARKEPYMPPSSAVSPWVFFSYARSDEPPPDRFWHEFGKQFAVVIERRLRPDGSVRARAAQIAKGATNDPEKVARIYDFCRTGIRNRAYADPAASGETKERDSDQSPGETLKRTQGNGSEIDLLFASMARALGMQSRIVLTGDRSLNLFDSTLVVPGFLNESCVAVWVESGWRYFDPAARYMPPGMLPWWEEGQDALILDMEQPRFVKLPISPADSSRGVSVGTFRLAADGTLEGGAIESFTGHWAAHMKELVRGQSPAERERTMQGKLEKQYPGAVVDSMRLENVDDPIGSFIGSYHIRIPGYAVRVGTRLLPAISFFEHGAEQILKGPTRRYPIHFEYAYSTHQTVDLELPEDFEVESVPEPKPVSAPGFAWQQPAVLVASDGRRIRFVQSSSVCSEAAISFPSSEYAAIKSAFDRMQEQNESTVALRRIAADPRR